MKKILYALLAIAMVAGVTSCKDQDDVYQEWIKPGGYIYPEITNDLNLEKGFNRLKLEWKFPKDPSIEKCIITWDNGTQEREINYADYAGQDFVTLNLPELEERQYTFTLTNYDNKGNKSAMSEVTEAPYGQIWLDSHVERKVLYAQVVDGEGVIVLGGKSMSELVETKFVYTNKEGKKVEYTTTLPADKDTIIIPDAAINSTFEYSSAYCPMYGMDKVWMPWTVSADELDPFIRNEKIWTDDKEYTHPDFIRGNVESGCPDWVTFKDGFFHVAANNTGTMRHAKIFMDNLNSYDIVQFEEKDVYGTYTFPTHFFSKNAEYTNKYGSNVNPCMITVTLGEPRLKETLTDHKGVKHTNNVGLRGLYYDAVLDGALEIDYKNKTARLGLFLDTRDANSPFPGAGQKVANGLAKSYAFFTAAESKGGVNKVWNNDWYFTPTNAGSVDYWWMWLTLNDNMQWDYSWTDVNGVQVITTIANQYWNKIVGITVGLASSASVSNSFASANYDNIIYQFNPKGYCSGDGGCFTLTKK